MTEAALADNAVDPSALPTWDLSHLYDGPEAAALKADLDEAERTTLAFRDRFAGRVASLDGPTLGQAVAEYERIEEILGRVMSFAYLHYAGDMADPDRGRFLQSMQEKVTAISSELIFFTLAINRLEQADVDALLAAPELARYAPWIRDVRAFREHQLSDDLERLLHEKAVAGRAAWMRLFDETIATLRFPVAGRQMTAAEALDCLHHRSGARRKEAAHAIGDVLSGNLRAFTHITNTLAKDKEIEDRWRRYAHPWSSRNLSNHVEDAVVEALAEAVCGAYPRLSHRYYAMKARWLGGDRLDYWDRNAPLPDADDRAVPWPEAERIVLDAYRRFSPTMAEIGARFFREGWIDAPARPGKAPGAFSHPTVPSAHPYVLLNYLGKTRDVMTLAHELGHGVHQVLAGGQGYLMADTPLTLAETASVFGEMLTFRSLLDGETDARRRKSMLAAKVEDMLNTVVRQIAFYRFEQRLHQERRDGELSAERIGEIWMSVQTESLGPALRFDDAYRVYWSYIPHFVHSPFYVYAYAFGDCLVNSLYAAHQDGAPDFAEKYMDLLKAGGTLRHRELLAPFGLDAGDPNFWQRGLDVIAGLIDELARLEGPGAAAGHPSESA